jgi:hypothetical protein
MGHDAEITAQACQDIAHHQPVQNAVGVVGNHHQRAGGRHIIKAAAHHLQRQAIARHHLAPEIRPLGHRAFIALRPPDQRHPPGQVFHRADHQPPGRGAGGMGIAQVAGNMRRRQHGNGG